MSEPATLITSVFSEVAPLSSSRGVELESEIGWAGQAWGDVEMLRRLLANLVRNAVEATPAGGVVEVTTGREGSKWFLSVKDEGQGIPGAIRERLFEPFATHGKSEGTGLGLAIVKNIAEAHGGAVSFRSEAAGGTVFRVDLPLAGQDSPAPQWERVASTLSEEWAASCQEGHVPST